jgi:hypothetical protein
MKKIALIIVFCLLALFFGCKKDHQDIDTTPLQTKIVLLNISDSATYTVFAHGMPDTALLLPGGSTKTYTIDPIKQFFILFARQGVIIDDTSYAALSLKEDTENIFILNDQDKRYVQCVGNVTTCYNPPAGRAIIRYINLSQYQKMEVIDNSNAVMATYNSSKLSVKQTTVDTVPYSTGSLCTSVAEGKYTIDIYKDGALATPAYTKTDVQVTGGNVYYVYLDQKNQIRVVQR